MSVRSKVGTAATLAVAPEAELAEGAAAAGGKAAAGKAATRKAARRHTAADPRAARTGSMRVQPDDDPNYQQPAQAGGGRGMPSALTDQRGAPGWWPSNGDPVKASNAGGGFLLAVITWAFVRAYLHGGAAEMTQLWRAKFFNQTEGATT